MARLGRALLGVWLTTLLSAFGSTVAVTQVESDIFNNPPAIIPGAQCPGTAQKWSDLFPDTVITSTPSNNNGLPDILIEADQVHPMHMLCQRDPLDTMNNVAWPCAVEAPLVDQGVLTPSLPAWHCSMW